MRSAGPIAVVVALALAVAPASVHAEDRRAAAEAIRISLEAKIAFDAGHFDEAQALYERAAQTDRSRVDYLWGVGRSAQRAGHIDAARAAFEAFLAKSGSTHRLRDKVLQALRELPQASEAQPAQPAAPAAHLPATGTTTDAPGTAERPSPRPAALLPAATAAGTAKGPQVAGRVRSAAPWLWTSAGLAAAAVGAWTVAGVEHAELDSHRGAWDGNRAADRQVSINAWSSAAVVTGALALATCAWGLWSARQPARSGLDDRSAPGSLPGAEIDARKER